ncbi:MAG: 2-aminoethylphosphonate--pyruvate transaminase [Treponema sp.]|jgi:2-aminoethylphosphonate-pyruvate transaminase|nr:2-aminoethylphosphonate--pyruvate transaminase [Treponema sp.]
MIRQAIIMAAGMGLRLKDRTAEMPKGFLETGGLPIVEWSVKKLVAAGVEEIIIGTGHCAEWYARLAERYSCVTLVHSGAYATTGSMGTLALCAEKAAGPALILESDLIYDDIGLFVLINDPRPNVILASGKTGSGDEVYLEADGEGRLLGNSKKKEDLGSVYGELVGITKLDKKVLDAMAAFYRSRSGDQPRMDYEAAMSALSRDALGGKCPEEYAFSIRKIDHYVWQEIDDESHYARAREYTYPRIVENESLRTVRRELLLNPGPATTSDSVKYAQVCADICPRETEFGAVMKWITEELSAFAGKPGDVETVLFGGSGTAADEVMISSCIPGGAKTLILDNGAYGERFAKIAAAYSIPHDVVKSSSRALPDTEALKRQLRDGGYTHFALVYHETTTGLLNPAPELCRFCKERGITTIVDAVSAFAAIPIDMERDGFDFMASTSNKNIQGMAGAAFVFCRGEALDRIREYPMRGYYLNLWDQYDHFKKTGQTRFTPPVQTLYALRQAIIETKIETIPARYRRLSACWEILVRGIKELGLKMLVPEEAQSKLITAVIDPPSPRYRFEELHDLARLRGFTIYPGKLSDASTFRIANIGDIRPEEMKRFTGVLKEYIGGLTA